MRTGVAYATALALDLAGAAGALLASTRTWQTVRTPRVGRPVDLLSLSGRTVDAAPTALALVALAGVVAVIATRGAARRLVGVLLVVAAIGLCWRSVGAASAVGTGRARSLVAARHGTVDVAAVVPHVVAHPVWAVLTVLCAVLVAVAGALTAWRGHRWQSLSARYERRPATPGSDPDAAERDAARAAATMWSSLDRGDDPTAG